MTATTHTANPALAPGVLIDIGEHCPPRCLTWDDQGVCWAIERTRRSSRRPETVPYRVIATVEDPEAFQEAIDGPHLTAVPDPEPSAVEPFDSQALTDITMWLLGYHHDHQPEVFAAPEWVGLDAVMAEDADDALVVESLEHVIGWCEQVDPGRLERGGWAKVVAVVAAYHAAGSGILPEACA